MIQNKLHNQAVVFIFCFPITLLVADGTHQGTQQKDYANPQESVQVESASTIFTLLRFHHFAQVVLYVFQASTARLLFAIKGFYLKEIPMIGWDPIQWLKRPPRRLMGDNRLELISYTLLMEHHPVCL